VDTLDGEARCRDVLGGAIILNVLLECTVAATNEGGGLGHDLAMNKSRVRYVDEASQGHSKEALAVETVGGDLTMMMSEVKEGE